MRRMNMEPMKPVEAMPFGEEKLAHGLPLFEV